MIRRIVRKALKTVLWIIISVIALLLLVTVLIRIPSVQTYVVKEAAQFVSDKTHTRIDIGYLGINFPQSLVLERVYAEDLTHDTLAYIGRLEVDINMLELFNSTLSVNNLRLDDATVKLVRTFPDSTFNFQFLIDAFSSRDTVTKQDTSSGKSNFNISAEDLKIANTRFLFADSVSGISFTTYAGLLEVSMDEIAPDSMLFYADEVFAENTHAVFTVFKNTVKEKVADTAVRLLPDVKANAIRLSGSSFLFTNLPDSSTFNFSAEDVKVLPELIDLNNMVVNIKSISVVKPVALIAMKTPVNEPAGRISEIPDTTLGWQVRAQKVTLQNGVFKMDFTNAPRLRKGIDYNHIYGQRIEVDLRNAVYNSRLIKGELVHASLTEQCGFSLKKLSTRFVYDDKHAELSALRLETPRTFVSNYIGITYPSIGALADAPGEMGITASMNKTKVHLTDVLYFVPDLINLPPFNGNADKQITVSGKLNGFLKDLVIPRMVVTAGEQTAIQINGTIKGLPDAAHAFFDLTVDAFSTTAQDMNELVGKQYLPQQVRIPQQLMLTGTYKGSITSFNAAVKLQSTQGNAEVRAALDMGAPELFSADVGTASLDLGYLLKNPALGKTTAVIKAKGQSFDQEKMVAKASGEIKAITLNRYAYQNITFNAAANKGKVQAQLHVNDRNVMLTMNATGNLEKDKEQVDALLNVTGANLKALGLVKDDLRTAGQVRASVSHFSIEEMDAYVGIGGLVIVSPHYRYRFDSITATMQNDAGNNEISLRSAIATADYKGSLPVDKLAGTLQQHINYYLNTGKQLPDTATGNFTFTANLKPHPVYSDLLLPELTRFSGLSISSSYNSSARQIQLKAAATNLVYAGNDVRDLDIVVNSDASQLTYRVGAENILAAGISLPKTSVTGNIKNGVIDNSIQVAEKDSGTRLLIRNEIRTSDRETVIRISDGRIILNNKEWAVPLNNQLTINGSRINAQNLLLSNNKSSISIQSYGATTGAPVDVKFTQFDLGELSQVIENDTPIVRGNLNGVLQIKSTEPFGFTSDLTIEDLSYQNILVGNVKVDADNLSGNRYTLKLVLSGYLNDATVSGYLENGALNLLVDLDRINMKTIEAFTPSQLKESAGYITGKITVKGSTSKPDIEGRVTFKEAQTVLAMINNRIAMNNETVTLDNQGVHFPGFTITDQSLQPMVVSGDIYTTDFMNMKFNLDIRTQNFTVMNTTARNNKEYYGKIIVNSNIRVRGTQDLPEVDANVRLIEGSAFTFVVQQGDLSTDIGEDIVQVINKDTNMFFRFVDTMTTAGSTIKGIDINANIQVDHNTVFTVIVDPASGDKLVVAGDAILNFGLDQSGKMSLTGTYTLTDGSYRASFQKVVKREFHIKQGSSITWTGDPMDARVGITAVYKTRAAATDLLAAELQGMGDNERNAYRKLLGYEVNLIINGELLNPELSFSINLDEKDRNAFGGMVDARLSNINNDPNELNKQVFALLILNKFLPPANVNTAGSAAGTSVIARNSVNQILSDQLNALSGRYIKGAELNVNIQSNDDYTSQGTTTQSTEVEVGLKKEFNDRLSVQVGGNVNVNDNTTHTTTTAQQNITGDVAVEYKITKDGRFRLKAFRENNYEGLIDGMLYKTGGGIIFSKDYDRLKDIFDPVKKEDEEELKPQKSEKK